MWAGYPLSTRKHLYWLGDQCTNVNPGSGMTLSFPIYHFRRCGSTGLQASRVICVADFTRHERVIISWRRRFAELAGYIGIPTPGSDFAVWFFVPWTVKPLIYLWHHPLSNEDLVDPVPHVVEDVTKLAWGAMAMDPDSGRHHRPMGPRTHSWLSAQWWVSSSYRAHIMLTTGPTRRDQSRMIPPDRGAGTRSCDG